MSEFHDAAPGHGGQQRSAVDIDRHLVECVYPALFDHLDQAFPEFAWQRRGGDAWEAAHWPANFPYAVEHEHPDRLMVYRDRPWWIKVHGHSGVRFLDLVNDGRRPRGSEFLPAYRKLCGLAGIPHLLPEPTVQEQETARQREERRAILDAVMVWGTESLWSQQGEHAVRYLTDGRGLTAAEMQILGLGLYLSEGAAWKALKSLGFDRQACKDAGVLNQKLEGYVLIPWPDEHGRDLTIYGRWQAAEPPLMQDLPAWQRKRLELLAAHQRDTTDKPWEEPRVPKTIALPGKNTKASPYCFHRVRQAGHREAILLEGVFDAAYLQVRGESRALAAVAAQLSGEQVKTLARCRMERIFICGDPDGGGDRGTLANVEALTRAGITPYVVPRLPDGVDPDEFVRAHGIESWRTHVAEAVHGFRHVATSLVASQRANGPWSDARRDAVVDAAVSYVAGFPEQQDDAFARHFWPVIREAVGGGDESLLLRVRTTRTSRAKHKNNGQTNGAVSVERGNGKQQKTKVRSVKTYRPFPVECLPVPICDYVAQAASAIGCDPAYVALPVLAVLASAIGNSRTVSLRRGWEEPCVFWTAIIGDSGTLKSPAYLKAVSYLLRVQRRLVQEFREQLKKHEKELAAWRKQPKGDDPDPPPDKPTLERVVCSDITIEKLAEILQDNPRGVLVARDELAGWLGSFTRYKGKGGGTDLPNWLEMFRSGTIIVDRKTGDRPTLFIQRAATCVTGGIQPGVLARALSPEFLDSGLAARLLLVMPPKLPKCWTEAEIDPVTEQKYEQTIDALRRLESSRDQDGEPAPHALALTREAKSAWKSFYNDWAQHQSAAEGEVAAAFSKLEAYAARLALLHHVVTCVQLEVDDRREIGPRSVAAGVQLCHWFASEARRIYSTLSESDDERDTRRLVEWILSRGGKTTAKDLQRCNSRKYPTAEVATAALEALVEARAGAWIDRPAKEGGGRPTRDLVLHAASDETDETDETSPREYARRVEASDETSDDTPCASDETPQNHLENRVSSVSSVVGSNGGVPPQVVVEVLGVSSDGRGVSSDGVQEGEL